MTKSLIFCLTLASAISQAAFQPYGGIGHALLSTDQFPESLTDAGLSPSSTMVQMPPSRYAHGSSTPAANVSLVASNGSTTGSNACGLPVVDVEDSITKPLVSYTVMYSAIAFAMTIATHCLGGCRSAKAISEKVNSQASGPTATATVSECVTFVPGSTTLSLQSTNYMVNSATSLAIPQCSVACTAPTNLQRLLSSARARQYWSAASRSYGMPSNATSETVATVARGTDGLAASAASAAEPASTYGNSTTAGQQTQIGAAGGKELSYFTFILACVVVLS